MRKQGTTNEPTVPGGGGAHLVESGQTKFLTSRLHLLGIMVKDEMSKNCLGKYNCNIATLYKLLERKDDMALKMKVR